MCYLPQGKPINVIPTELVRPHSFVALQKHLREIRYPDMPMHTSLSAFQNNNRKQGHITVSEAWARMLLVRATVRRVVRYTDALASRRE